MLKSVEPAQRVVIYRLGSLGDTVIALPFFHKIAQNWPSAERIVLTNHPVSSKAAPLDAVLRDSGLIHETIAYPVGTRSIGDLWRVARHLRGLHAEVLVYLTPARGRMSAIRDWLYFKLCGFKTIIGAPLSGDSQTWRQVGVANPGGPVEERESERLARCLRALGPVDLDDPRLWDLRLTDREVRKADALLAAFDSVPYFAINMGGKAGEKDWGAANWRQLLDRLTGEYADAGLLIVGAAEDSDRAEHAAASWCGPVVNLCGRVSPREAAAAMRHAAAFIGHDSGPLHLAAVVGVRCVGLFGSFNPPNRWHPRGRQHRIIHRMSGIHTISVHEVLDSVRSIVPLRHEIA